MLCLFYPDRLRFTNTIFYWLRDVVTLIPFCPWEVDTARTVRSLLVSSRLLFKFINGGGDCSLMFDTLATQVAQPTPSYTKILGVTGPQGIL